MFYSCRIIACLGFLCVASASQQPVINVHIVAHTHDDVGWLKTVDEYYAGLNNSIQHAYVRMIIDTVIKSLEVNPNRTFTYVEQAFFQRWWRQQTDEVKELTKRLVKSGQLEFTNGGWCMHDEAAPHYMDMIDQTTLGHKFLMDEFGVAPKTGWQLDPFGHSATQAALLSAEVGFQGLFFGRIDRQDLEVRLQNQAAEFIWRGSPSLGKDAQVFSGLTGEYHGYGPPRGFDWNIGSNDEPIQDDLNLEDYNVKSRVDDFVREAQDQAAKTRGVNVMWTMGSDFQYEDAFEWFYNLDKIIKHVNEDGRVRAFYSSPSRYVAAKAAEEVTWPLKEDDFFPYADGPHAFWTGYFTSRPALKRYIRDTSGFFQVAKQLIALSGNSMSPGLQRLAEAMGVVQHHDAVSGTAKQHVTFDYAKKLSIGRAAALGDTSSALGKLTKSEEAFTFCDFMNVSLCAPTQSVGKDTKNICFALYNGLAHDRHDLVELPVSVPNVKVTRTDGMLVKSQLLDALPSITNYGQPAGGSAQSLIIEVDIPGMGASTYCMEEAGSIVAEQSEEVPITARNCAVLENSNIALEFCAGSLNSITDKASKLSTRASHSWYWYESSTGTPDDSQASGAYIFRPNASEANPAFGGQPTIRMLKGSLVSVVDQTFGSWISQRYFLPADARHAQITYTVGPVPIDDGKGKEVVSRFSTDLKNNGECFTDSNGREMIYRKRDFRPSWKYNQTEPVSGNYFPVTTSLFIRDSTRQLTMLTETSQAGTGCVKDGELELMVHRRVLKDDSRGVGEPLNESQFVNPYVGDNQGQHLGPGLVIRGTHRIILAPPADSAAVWRPLVDQSYLPTKSFFTNGDSKLAGFAPLAGSLPKALQIVTLGPWDDGKILLRIAHQFGLEEDTVLSKPQTIDLKSIFASHEISEVEERGLAATIPRSEVLNRRVSWQIEGEDPLEPVKPEPTWTTIFTFGPLQIRTFVLKVSANSKIYI